ncbi:dihydrolipoyl dehydrogenase family protein [Paractinoplanes atraurantiacus]|uniref:Dihydrolipoamide dehydrogenase/glutathione reductase (NADPH) n=1 Tax=Paractinoplanes atraurantiacus TaxID=1036182 RepID=A0A285JRL4_9ACTN|nr:NAD(P)/FAD-dependent oxidoreductase [Actinoplanes atraurantiacus]SNY62942.1 dihydrolipoamide dehydrogenase/glutathione reductase (NADPH) [Actinoplanes atraurantiacus]
MTSEENADVCVLGAGPAGLSAALRAARLGARTVLVTRDAVGGMAAAEGPVPVRALAQAARLRREARHLHRYGIDVGDSVLDFPRLLGRVREVVAEVAEHSMMRAELAEAGVIIVEHAGTARFTDPHTIEAEPGLRLHCDKVIVCAGGTNRVLPVPGAELVGSQRDAWAVTSVPESLLMIGAGATGAQVASVFAELGTRVTLFEAGPRILATEDEDVSRVMAEAFRAAGIDVREGFGRIERFEKVPAGVRMVYAKDGVVETAEASLAVAAIGWLADTAGLNLGAAGVDTNARGYVQVDAELRTSAEHVFAAGDVTGRLMLVPHAVQDGYLAATNAVTGRGARLSPPANPIGSFTDPEYAQIGPTEAQARHDRDVVVATEHFADVVRPIIDGRPAGFCKLIVDTTTHQMIACHIVGERAVEIAQVAAVAVAAAMPVEQFIRIPLSFPTYTNVLGRAALNAARQLGVSDFWD